MPFNVRFRFNGGCTEDVVNNNNNNQFSRNDTKFAWEIANGHNTPYKSTFPHAPHSGNNIAQPHE